MWERYLEDPLKIANKMAPKVRSWERLDDDNGAKVWHYLLKLPIPLVSDRSFVLVSFDEWVSSDEFITASTTN